LGDASADLVWLEGLVIVWMGRSMLGRVEALGVLSRGGGVGLDREESRGEAIVDIST
jgi:hypothetical protein